MSKADIKAIKVVVGLIVVIVIEGIKGFAKVGE